MTITRTSVITALTLAISAGPILWRPVGLAAADDARQIVLESDRRSSPATQKYEGILRVTDDKGRSTEKRWMFERLGSHGTSRTIIRFTAPAEVKGVALLIASHPDKASDQWMWTPAIERDRRKIGRAHV